MAFLFFMLVFFSYVFSVKQAPETVLSANIG